MLLRYEVSGTVVIEFKDFIAEIYARYLEEPNIHELEFEVESISYNNEEIIDCDYHGNLITLKLENNKEIQLYASEIFEYAIDPDLDFRTIFEIEYFEIDESILDFCNKLIRK